MMMYVCVWVMECFLTSGYLEFCAKSVKLDNPTISLGGTLDVK